MGISKYEEIIRKQSTKDLEIELIQKYEKVKVLSEVIKCFQVITQDTKRMNKSDFLEFYSYLTSTRDCELIVIPIFEKVLKERKSETLLPPEWNKKYRSI